MNLLWPDLLVFIAMTMATDTVQIQNENLLMTTPDGYKTDFYEKTTDMITSEMVPVNESADSWTGIVRVQIFHALNATPAQFKLEMDKARARVCSERSSRILTETQENGYATIWWYDQCLWNAATASPGFTWFKGIQGNDSDPPPLKWSDLRYVFDIKEDCNGKEAIQA
jgi:hypothetical protein